MAIRNIIVLLIGLALWSIPDAEAQQPGKVPRIGFLDSSTASSNAVGLEAFWQEMRKLGWIEGKNIAIEYRYAEGKRDRFPELAAELVRLKVDLIVVEGTGLALAAKSATTTIPIVVTTVGDPVGAGLVASLARPGGNVTGLSFLGPETVAKCLQLLKEAVPSVTRAAVLSHPGNPSEATRKIILKETEAAARALALQLQFLEARGPEEFERAFAEMGRGRAGGLTVVTSIMFFSERKRLVELAAKHKLPAVYPWREPVDAGGLLAYGPNLPDIFRRAAGYVDRIVKGAKPADMPVEQPVKFELVVNLKAARALGLTLPPSLIARADHVIN